MMHMTAEMEQARHALHELSASDPVASANMLRHVAAIKLMVTGRQHPRAEGGEPIFQAGFPLAPGEKTLLMGVTARTGTDQVFMAFDVDDAAGTPVGLGIFRCEGDAVASYPRCLLWSPASSGRTVIVRAEDGRYPGHFVFRHGRPLRHVDGPPAGDLEAGFKRANARQLRMVASRALSGIHREGFRTVFSNNGPNISARSFRAAA